MIVYIYSSYTLIYGIILNHTKQIGDRRIMSDGYLGFNTLLLHNVKKSYSHGSTHIPIYQSSAFKHESAEELEKIFTNKSMGFSYTRINNPTIEDFEKRVTALEGGVGAVACSSGMSALFNALMNVLQSGDEIIASAGLYGGTVELFTELEAFGITTRYVAHNLPDEYEKLITDKTRVIFAETIGNPKLDVTDISALANVAHSHNIPLIIDNTTATPYLVKPLSLGADVVVHSSSKYINGNSDAISGILISGGKFKWDDRFPGLIPYKKFGPLAYIAKLRAGLFRSTGGCLSPQNAFLNILGLETLGLRLERECDNALELARHLKELDDSFVVNYPGLEESAYHKLATDQLNGRYGAIVTVRVGSKERAFAIMNELKIPYILSNIGDTKTLVLHPASTIAVTLSKEEQEQSGVYDDLIRISVGIEDIKDLKEDFTNAVNNTK